MSAQYVVSGERVSMRQICERLGLCDGTARSRLKRAAKDPGPVTWESLAIDRRVRHAPKSHPWRADRSGDTLPKLPAPDEGRKKTVFGGGGRPR